MAKKISRIRAQNKLTQKQFAELCNISKSVLSQYEQGTRNPSNRALYRICNGLDLNPAVFGLPTQHILYTQETKQEIRNENKKEEGVKPMENRLQNHLLDEIESLKQMNAELVNKMKTLESQPPPPFSWTESYAEKFAITLNANSSFQEIANELHIKSQQWNFLFDNINQPLGISRKGVIREVNKDLLDQFGYDKNDMIGKRSAEFIHPDEQERLKEVLTSNHSDYIWRMKKKNGNYCKVRVQRQAFGDPDNGFAIALMTCVNEGCPDVDESSTKEMQ